MKLKNAYYYIICLVSLFVLLWGVVDLAGAGIGLATARSPMIASEPSAESPSAASAPDASMDIYYQKKLMVNSLQEFHYHLKKSHFLLRKLYKWRKQWQNY